MSNRYSYPRWNPHLCSPMGLLKVIPGALPPLSTRWTLPSFQTCSSYYTYFFHQLMSSAYLLFVVNLGRYVCLLASDSYPHLLTNTIQSDHYMYLNTWVLSTRSPMITVSILGSHLHELSVTFEPFTSLVIFLHLDSALPCICGFPSTGSFHILFFSFSSLLQIL